jgi:hypothetical protein
MTSLQWCRLWPDMPTDPKFRTIARASKQPLASVVAVYVFMMTDASANAAERGRTHASDETIASALDLDDEAVAAIRAAMQGRVLDDDRMSGWAKRQPKREDDSAERAKAWREAQRAKEGARTQPNAAERERPLEERREEEKREDKENQSVCCAREEPSEAARSRGTNRLSAADFSLGQDGDAIAKRLGLTPAEIEREERCWRNANLDKPAKTRAAWLGLWENWCVRFVEKNPRSLATATATIIPTIFVHAQGEAWSRFANAYRAKHGKPPPTDSRGGWHFPADLVPAH